MSPAPQLEFIHRFVPSPSGATATLLLLHGTGGDEDDLLPLGAQLLPGAALLSPRGRVLENGMPRFFRRLAEGVFDLDDLKQQTAALALFIQNAAEKYDFATHKLIAVGYSNGANIAASLMLTTPKLLRRAVLFRAMVPFVPDTPPDLNDHAALLAAGRHDSIVPAVQTATLAQILQNAGARVSLHWHDGGHELGQDDLLAAQHWLGEQHIR